MLYPNFKLEYFQNRGWDQTWINTAEEIVREEAQLYMNGDVPLENEMTVVSPVFAFDFSQILILQQSWHQPHRLQTSIFLHI